MGGGASVIYIVDENPAGHVVGFSPQCFVNYEWPTLKLFCNTYDIHQYDLVRVFKMYLTNDEVYLREFRIKTLDVKCKFLSQTTLLQELADTFMPPILNKEFKGLEKSPNADEVTFSRLCIMSYIFCAQQIPDLVYEFFSALKQKMNLQLSTVFFYFNLEMLIELLVEDLKPSGSLALLMKCIANERKDKEIKLRSILRMAVKYPILFYSLQRFRKYMQRCVFGDKFWSVERKPFKLKLRFEDVLSTVPLDEVTKRYTDESTALRSTAITIITDAINGSTGQIYQMSDTILPPMTELNERNVLLLKHMLGYKASRRIILESGLPLTCKPIYLSNMDVLSTGLPDTTEDVDITSIVNSTNSVRIAKSIRRRKAYEDNSDSDAELSLSSSSSEGSVVGGNNENQNTNNNSSRSREGIKDYTPQSKARSQSRGQSQDAADENSALNLLLKDASSPSATRKKSLASVRSNRSQHSHSHSHNNSHGDRSGHSLHSSGSRRSRKTSNKSKILLNRVPSRRILTDNMVSATVPSDGSTAAQQLKKVSPSLLSSKNGLDVILDTKTNRYFRYDVTTGRRQWSQLFLDIHGAAIKQRWI